MCTDKILYMYALQNKQHSIHKADDKDPLNFRDYDDNKIKEKVIPRKLRRFFDIKEGEDLEDYDMVNRRNYHI